MNIPGMAVVMLGLAALAAAAPPPPLAVATEGEADMSQLVVTTVCTIYSDYLEAALAGGMDSVLGAVGGQMPGCEVTTEYVEVTAAPSVVVDIPGGSLFPACAEDNSCFDPHTVAVDVGAQVVWTNSDTVLHTVTDPAGTFDRWLLPGEEFAFTFDAPGTYMYGCVVHPWAGGTVVVGEDAAPYDSEPDTAVRAVEDFITMYDSEGTAAFETVNGMEAEDIYPFAIDAGTLAVVAEGAFPRVVGLPAIFLHDADRPLAEILAELEGSEGVWAEYVFYNPETSYSEAKMSYLSLHDGYIFGSGYYMSPDVGAADAVDVMLRMYSTLGDRAFENFGLVPTGAFNVPFVLDADTMDIVVHANPGLSGGDVRDAMASGQSLELVHDMLERHGSLWLSYPSADPAPGAEYTRAYLLLRDGYVFASGYGVDAGSRLQSLVDESVRLYEREGDAAFDTIGSSTITMQTVYDLQESKVLALSVAPQYKGLALPLSAVSGLSLEEFLQLYEQGGAWVDRFDKYADGVEMRLSTWSILHDDRYWFAAARSYSPEAAAVAEVDAAIGLYQTYGEAAFDHITWQAVDPAIVYPFVFDAETWQTVAHAGYPDRLGLLPTAIMADHDLDEISEELAENEDVWVSYKFYNPVTDLVEHKRTWLTLHDGYIFAAGYYYGNFDNAEGIIAGAMAGYDANGEAAFEAINSEMSGSLHFSPLVLDYDTLDVVAHGGYPDLVGQNVNDIAFNGDKLEASIRASLMEDGDFVLAPFVTLDPQSGLSTYQHVIFQLHDGYVFATTQPMVLYTQ